MQNPTSQFLTFPTLLLSTRPTTGVWPTGLFQLVMEYCLGSASDLLEGESILFCMLTSYTPFKWFHRRFHVAKGSYCAHTSDRVNPRGSLWQCRFRCSDEDTFGGHTQSVSLNTCLKLEKNVTSHQFQVTTGPGSSGYIFMFTELFHSTAKQRKPTANLPM